VKAASERQLIRILHLVLSIPIVGYIYGPVASIPRAARFTRWVAMPAVVLTGFWLWLQPQLLGWLRRRHRGGARKMLFSLTALVSLMSSAATARSAVLRVGDAFPYSSAQKVTGKPLALPEAASGKTALVIFTFGRAAARMVRLGTSASRKTFKITVFDWQFRFNCEVPVKSGYRQLQGFQVPNRPNFP